MVDKNGNLVRVGDTVQNKAGVIGTLTIINGVCKIIIKNEFGRITQSIPCKEINLKLMAKVE